MRNVCAALVCFLLVTTFTAISSAQQWVQTCDDSGCRMVWQPAARPVARLVDRLTDPPPVLQAARAQQAASCGSDMPLQAAEAGQTASCGSDMPLRAAPPILLYHRETGTIRPFSGLVRRAATRLFERFRRPLFRRFR